MLIYIYYFAFIFFINTFAAEMSEIEKNEYSYILNQSIIDVFKYLNEAKSLTQDIKLIKSLDNIINKINSKKLDDALNDLNKIENIALIENKIVNAKVLLSKIITSESKSRLLTETIFQHDQVNIPSELSKIIVDFTGYGYQEVFNLFDIVAYDYSPDGKYLVVSITESDEGRIGKFIGAVTIYDIASNKYIKLEGNYNTVTKKDLKDYKVHSDYVRKLCWSPNGLYITTYFSHEILIWDINTGKLIVTKHSKFPIENICWTPDSSKIICIHGGNTSSVYNLNNDELNYHSREISWRFSLSSNNILANSYINNVEIVDLSKSEIIAEINTKETYSLTSWSKNGILAIANKNTINLYKNINNSFQEISCINIPKSIINSLDFSPDSSKLLIAGYEGDARKNSNVLWNIKIYNLETNSISDIIYTNSVTTSVRWSPCGKYISLKEEALTILGKTLE